MGIRDAALTEWLLWNFSKARVHNEEAAIWSDCEFLWVDGSLYYRARRWEHHTSWQGYLDDVCNSLRRMVAQCPQLRVLIYQIDKYGPGTVAPEPKRPTQDHRYKGARDVPDPARTYQPDAPCKDVSSTDTFGKLPARMAFNEMVSAALEACMRDLLASHPTLELIVLDGAVRGGRAGLITSGATHLLASSDQLWCPHSEGDIGLAHWFPQLATLNTVIHSADVDLQQVSVQLVRRMCDGGLLPANLPRIHIYKQVNGSVATWDVVRYYQEICTVISPLMPPGDLSHPVDVWAALIALSGNDFCAPIMCSDECAIGEGNDGLRLMAIWTAFFKHASTGPPLFEPTTDAHRHPRTWSVCELPTWVYPMQLRVDAWTRLLQIAACLQGQYKAVKSARSMDVLFDANYVARVLMCTSWALTYYANAALLGETMPRGTEVDAAGRSKHGWVVSGESVSLAPVMVPIDKVASALAAQAAPTRPPSPAPADPLTRLAELEAEMEQ